ncbi:sensor histidine kinase [Colwellia sp. D2M02]|uniref:sensor histidine kinase n=1 Tax=Colwellia sp. D2M02 TaxID=2841562 RepID=UPI001C0A214C|nr:ATP-binding protein [Colwellia sp. D2M02]MBU2894178.1 sensor histidine kinase [Colwellia sp. D2M02]
MPNSVKTKSFRSLLLKSTLGLTITLAALTALLLLLKINTQQRNEIESNTWLWASILADKSLPFLKDDPTKTNIALKKELTELSKNITLINRIHIYDLNDNSVSFFTSYNKNNSFPAIKDKINEIDELTTIRYHEQYLELVVEIKSSQKTVGYVYLQTSLTEKNDFFSSLLLLGLFLLISAISIAVLTALWLYKKTCTPLDDITELIDNISQKKRYDNRAKKQEYKEFDILARYINILLTVTEKHIYKLEDDHHYALSQNNELKSRVESRTSALKDSNQELLSTLEKLHQYQGQLVESEKMASLGDMVAGIAHEINTPIGLGVTASSLLADNLNNIKERFDNKTLKSSELKRFLNDGEENIAIIFRNLERAANLISSFKKVAVDQSSAESRTFDVHGLIDEVLLTLSAKIKSAQVTVIIDCPENLTITSKPGPLNQILINLILNSIHHAFDGITAREVSIKIQSLSDQLNIHYHDNGVGIDESIKNKIFDPFTTTKRGSGGSGLGMHLVYNLVTQALIGHISMHSEPQQGVDFDITFPIERTIVQ